MYPHDNIFNIYYNIGKRLPFQVKRCDRGYYSQNWETRTSTDGRTFIVEKIEPRGKYGKAYGYALVDNIPNDEYLKIYYPEYKVGEIVEIPCCGCGGWVLVDVPGVDMETIFPKRTSDFKIEFGKYKGQTIGDIYRTDPQYIYWLMEQDHYFKIDFYSLLNISPNSLDAQPLIEAEINRVFPKVTIESIITFGKYKGKTFKEVYLEDPAYIEWFLRNFQNSDIDVNSFLAMMTRK